MTGKSKKEDAEETNAGKQKTDSNEDLRSQLDDATAKADQYLDMARRLQADFDNYRKRTQKETEDFRKYAAEGLIKEILPIIDDLDRALANTSEDNEFVKGVKGVRQNLMKTLEANGVTEIPAEGKFDPSVHEALCVVDGDTDGDIAEVFQKGYRLGDRVIRYSKVIVTKIKEEEQ